MLRPNGFAATRIEVRQAGRSLEGHLDLYSNHGGLSNAVMRPTCFRYRLAIAAIRPTTRLRPPAARVHRPNHVPERRHRRRRLSPRDRRGAAFPSYRILLSRYIVEGREAVRPFIERGGARGELEAGLDRHPELLMAPTILPTSSPPLRPPRAGRLDD